MTPLWTWYKYMLCMLLISYLSSCFRRVLRGYVDLSCSSHKKIILRVILLKDLLKTKIKRPNISSVFVIILTKNAFIVLL